MDIKKNNEIIKNYIKKLGKDYEELMENKYYKYYLGYDSINHIKGIHLDFYYKPYIFLNKKYPELIFRNIILKNIIRLNKLLYNEVILPRKSVEIMIEQCKLIMENKDYWIRNNYHESQIIIINETYIFFTNFLKSYLHYLDNTVKNTKLNLNIVGLGMSNTGDKLYEYILQYQTGFPKMTANKLQDIGIHFYQKTVNRIKSETGLSLKEALANYKKNQTFYNSETDFMSNTKYNIIKLEDFAKNIFDKSIDIPYSEKISIKSMPFLKSIWTPISRAQKNTLFINSNNWNKISKEHLLKICAHETIPGHFIERYNSNKIFDQMSIKLKSKLKKAIQKSNNSRVEGWGLYSNYLVNKFYDSNNTLNIIFSDLFISVKMIIDIGLHSKSPITSFTFDTACEFLKHHSILSDQDIYYEVLKCLVKPGLFSSSGFGYLFILDLLKDFTNNQENIEQIKKFNSLFLHLPLNLSLSKDFILNKKI